MPRVYRLEVYGAAYKITCVKSSSTKHKHMEECNTPNSRRERESWNLLVRKLS